MRNKKQEQTTASQQQPPPQVIYVERKKGGCFGTFFKIVGFGFIALIGLVVLAAVIGSNSDKDEDNPPARSESGAAILTSADDEEVGSGENPAPIGTTITRDGLEITIHSVKESDTAGVLTSYKAGWEYLIIDVTVKNVSDDTKSFNQLYWSAKDIDNGYTYDDELFGGDANTSLGSGDLSPNDLVRGEVPLKVRTDGPNIRIKYDTSPIGGANLYWLYQR